MNEHILEMVRKSCKPYSWYMFHKEYPKYLRDYENTVEVRWFLIEKINFEDLFTTDKRSIVLQPLLKKLNEVIDELNKNNEVSGP